jgi:hypothetical protein
LSEIKKNRIFKRVAYLVFIVLWYRGCYSFIWNGGSGGDIVVAAVIGPMER